jgi:hypothetical protein
MDKLLKRHWHDSEGTAETNLGDRHTAPMPYRHEQPHRTVPVTMFRTRNSFLSFTHITIYFPSFNLLTPNDRYSGRTAPITSKGCILYMYSTNIGTEYFKHDIYSPVFFSSKCSLFHNSNIFGSRIIHIYTQDVLKLKK